MSIKPSTNTQFPVGSKVKVVNKGQVCTTYSGMADYMRLAQLGYKWAQGYNVLKGGEVGVVIAKAMHEMEYEGEILAIKVGECVSLILSKGVVEYEPVAKETTIRWEDLKAGQKVKFVGMGEGHIHWEFKLGGIYNVVIEHYKPAVVDAGGDYCAYNYAGWEIVLVEDIVEDIVEPTIDELKSELAETKAKLWDAEQKLKKINQLSE